MEKVNLQYDLVKIKLEIKELEDTLGWLNEKHMYLQTPDGNPYVSQLLRSSPENNKRYTEFVIDPSTEIAKFITENNLYRTRILKLKSGQCYSWHRDKELRMHLAVITNKKCFVIENEKMQHVPDNGHPYIVNTHDKHTAMNCNPIDFDRIHIVGTIPE